MFGKEAKKQPEERQGADAELRARLDVAENHPYLPLAMEIQADVARLMESTVGVDDVVNLAIDHAHEATLQQALEARLAGVPVMDLLRAFDERIGSDEVNAYLAKYALAEFQQLKTNESLLDMRREAMQTRRVDLSKLPIDAIVTIGLFSRDASHDAMSYRHRDWARRTFVGRVDNAEKPYELTILEDVTIPGYVVESNITNSYSSLAKVEFGRRVYVPNGKSYFSPKDYVIEPDITYGTHLGVGSGREGTPAEFWNCIVGYIKVNDIVVLDNPDDMKAEGLL